MGLYNSIRFESRCPQCGTSTLQVQCHVATSGTADQEGRFALEVYRLGDRMRWWPILHERWASCFNGGDIALFKLREAIECCYGSCMSCKENIYAIIRFKDRAFGSNPVTGESMITPVEVLDLGCEKGRRQCSCWRCTRKL